MTRQHVNLPVWAWVCDQCGQYGPDLEFRQQDLHDVETMRALGWRIGTGPPWPMDLCPKCNPDHQEDPCGGG